MKAGGRLLICIVTLCAGCKFINYVGAIYAENVDGYRRGNRYRVVSIVWLEWIMLHLDLLIYAHLFSYFQQCSPAAGEVGARGTAVYKALGSEQQRGLSVVWRMGNGGANKAARARVRLRLFGLYAVVVLLAHLTYLLYLVYDFTIPWPVVELAGWCNGVWLHLFAFSFLFLAVNSLMGLCSSAGKWGRLLIERLQRLPLVGRLLSDNRFQVRVTLVATALLCLTHWLAAGRLTVREAEIQLGGASLHSPSSGGVAELRVVLLSDLHGGASVYRDAIAAVVDRTNALEADVVLIVGDAIDAPVSLIADRMEPLRHLRARLGVFFTTGNHDYYYGDVREWIDLFQSLGIRTLVNEKVAIGGDAGAKLCLVGLNDASAWKSGVHRSDSSAIGQCPLHEPIVVLAHNPAAATRIVADAKALNRTVDLILSGHTHAGQYYVIVPFVYWLLPYFYGLYELVDGGGAKLLVSAGTLYQGSPMKMPKMSEIWLLHLRWPSS